MLHSEKTPKWRRSYRAQAVERAGHGLWSGILMGLAAIPWMYSIDFIPPRYTGSGVRGDWQTVGRQIRSAMNRAADDLKIGRHIGL